MDEIRIDKMQDENFWTMNLHAKNLTLIGILTGLWFLGFAIYLLVRQFGKNKTT